MTKVLCPRYCPVPYCEPVCPTNAIRISDQKVEVIPALCIGCGLCRKSCMTWSLEKPLEHKSVQWMMRDSKEPVAESLCFPLETYPGQGYAGWRGDDRTG